jgi:site-specific recombinase XerD
MTIKKDGDKWLVDVRPAGRTGRRFRKKFDKKSEALAYEKHILATEHNKKWVSKPKDTRNLSELIEVWWTISGQFKRTAIPYKRDLARFCRELDDPAANKIDAKLISDWVADMQSRNLKDSTIRRSMQCLSNIFTVLIESGNYHHENPLKGIKRPTVKREEMAFLTLEQIKTLRAEIQSNEMMLNAVDICLSTGARWREMILLKSSNLSPHRIRFTQTKTDKPRTVPISEELYERIYPKRGGALFPYDFQKELRQILIDLEFELPKSQKTHILRHTFASHFIMNGGNILTLQKILGHSDIKQTLGYAHLAPDFLQDAVRMNPLSMSTL